MTFNPTTRNAIRRTVLHALGMLVLVAGWLTWVPSSAREVAYAAAGGFAMGWLLYVAPRWFAEWVVPDA